MTGEVEGEFDRPVSETPPKKRAPKLSKDQQIGRRAAYANMAAVGLQLLVGGVLLLVNIILAGADGTQPHVVDEDETRRFINQWRGLLPIDVPWWVYLITALPMLPLVLVVWDARRHYAEPFNGRYFVVGTPGWFGMFSLFLAAHAFFFGQYYVPESEWYLPLIPAGFLLGVAALGISRSVYVWMARRRRARR